MTNVLTLTFVLLLACSGAGADECASIKDKTASVTVGFRYSGPNEAINGLSGVGYDRVYLEEMGKSVAGQSTMISEKTMGDSITKKQFLDKLKASIAGKDYVNFNYAGHGVRMPDGEWAMLLPGMTKELAQSCSKGVLADASGDPSGTPCARGFSRTCSSDGTRGFGRADDTVRVGRLAEGQTYTEPPKKKATDSNLPLNCEAFQDHLVKNSELKAAFAGKKVFGLNDSCFSGSMNLGPDSQMINAAQGKEQSSDGMGLSRKLRYESIKNCTLHVDKDGAAAFSEILRDYPYEEDGEEGLKGLDARWSKKVRYQAGLAPQTPTRTGARTASWSSCMKVILPENECGKSGSSGSDAPAAGDSDAAK